MDTLASDEDLFEQAYIHSETGKLMGMLSSVLTDREKSVIVHRYGLYGHKPLPQREVADLLGISRSYVSRIEKRALSKLKAAMEDDKSKGM